MGCRLQAILTVLSHHAILGSQGGNQTVGEIQLEPFRLEAPFLQLLFKVRHLCFGAG